MALPIGGSSSSSGAPRPTSSSATPGASTGPEATSSSTSAQEPNASETSEAAASPSAAAPAGDRFESRSSASSTVTGAAVSVQLAPAPSGTTSAPPANLPPIDPARVPDDAALQSATPTSRARLLGRLSATQREAEAMPPGAERDAHLSDTQAAIDRVIDNVPDGRSLENTLEVAAKNGTLGAITESVGLERLIEAGNTLGTNVNDVLATSDTVKERGLTSYERERIEDNFANTLDPDSVRFKFTTGAQTMGAGAMVIGNTIHVDPSDPRWGFEPGTTRPANERAAEEYNQTLLAHEPTHVWSYQHQGSQYAINSVTDQANAIAEGGGRGGAYGYEPGRASFFDYGEEQRAMIMQDHVAAERAQQRGATSVYLPGQGARVSVAEALSSTAPYMAQIRAAGPGNPHPPGAAEAHTHGPANGQDGVADLVANHADALVAGAGRTAMNAVASGDPLQVAAGAVGIAGVIAGSLVTREQNDVDGASGGGSALLDQAGIPRGVEVSGDDFGVEWSGAARLGYDAGSRDEGIVAAPANPRVELAAGAAGEVGDASLQGNVAAEIGLDGSLRQASAAFSVQTPDVSAFAQGSYDGRGEDDIAQASVDVQGSGFGVQASGNVRWNEAGVQAANLSARVDTAPFSVDGDVAFGPGWQFASADVNADLRQPGWSVYASASFAPGGLDALGGGVSAQLGDSSTLSASVRAEDLLSDAPTYNASVALGGDGATLEASGQHQPATGIASFRIGAVIPLKP